MRKVRDYDAELKALGDKARALKAKKVSNWASWSRPPGPMRSISMCWPARCSPPSIRQRR
jgi:hypothetical protein